jgi:hypothetical protein
MKGFLFLLMLWDWADTGTYAQDAVREPEEEVVYEVFQEPFSAPPVEAP